MAKSGYINRRDVIIGGIALSAMARVPARAQSAAPLTLISNVKIFDGVNDALIENGSVLVEGQFIATVSREPIVAPDAMQIDGGGRTLIPGLIDSHQHVMLGPTVDPLRAVLSETIYTTAYAAIPQAKKLIDMGVTSIRDLGGPSIELGRAIDAGHIEGPRIMSAGHFVGATSGHGDFGGFRYLGGTESLSSDANRSLTSGWSILADGPSDVRWAVRTALANGSAYIKVMAGGGVASVKDPLESVGYSEDEFRAAVEAAADYDTYVACHAYNDESVQRMIRAGVADNVHGHLMSEETVAMMAEAGMWLSSLSNPVGLMDVPFFTDENRRKAGEVVAGYEQVMGWAKQYGVKIGWGTDAASSMLDTVLLEFQQRSPFFTPTEMLKQATSANGQLFELARSRNPYRAAKLGVIEEGAWADILLYGGDPTEDIGVVIDYQNTLDLIMKDGKVHMSKI